MYIQYSIPTNEDYYTNDEVDHELITGLLENIENKVCKYIKKNYPKARYDVVFVTETMSNNNKSRVDGDTDHEILEDIDNYIGANWFNWWPK